MIATLVIYPSTTFPVFFSFSTVCIFFGFGSVTFYPVHQDLLDTDPPENAI